MAGGGGGGGGGAADVDKRYATLVVGASESDYTDLASAVAALPAGGGEIYVQSGTYSISASIALPDKPVKIRGAGPATVFDLGNNNVTLFTFDFDQPYEFEDFRVVGTNGNASQGLISIGASVTGAAGVTLDDVRTLDVHSWISVDPAATPVVTSIYCEQNFTASDATAMTWAGPGFWNVHLFNCNIIPNGGGFALSAGVGADVFATDCTFSLLGGGDVDTMDAGGGGGTYFYDGTLVPLIGNLGLANCAFQTSVGGAPARWVDIGASVDLGSISATLFRPSATVEDIRIAGQNISVKGFSIFGSTSTKITEVAGADNNRYSGIDYGSTIIGPGSTVDAAGHRSISGQATTGAFVQFLLAQSIQGLGGKGTIKNTGGTNALNVKESVTDFFGTSSSQTNAVAPGADRTLDPTANIGTARAPYTSYKVEVDHPVAATTFDLEFVALAADFVSG